jgi:predicted  nucleic acid-binding Zn-ribbon protein
MSVSFDFNFWTVLLLVLNFSLAFFVAMSNRGKAKADELSSMKTGLQSDIKSCKDSINQRISQHGERLSRIEADLDNSIQHSDITAVHRRVDELMTQSNQMAGQLKEISDSLKQISGIMMRGNRE